MTSRKFIVLMVAALAVPATAAGLAVGVAVAFGCERLRVAFADPFGHWGEPDD